MDKSISMSDVLLGPEIISMALAFDRPLAPEGLALAKFSL